MNILPQLTPYTLKECILNTIDSNINKHSDIYKNIQSFLIQNNAVILNQKKINNEYSIEHSCEYSIGKNIFITQMLYGGIETKDGFIAEDIYLSINVSIIQDLTHGKYTCKLNFDTGYFDIKIVNNTFITEQKLHGVDNQLDFLQNTILEWIKS